MKGLCEWKGGGGNMKLWLEMKDELVNIRGLNDKWMRIASETLGSPLRWVQFDRDVKLYGLYEAVLMVEDEERRFALQDKYLAELGQDAKAKLAKIALECLGWDTMPRPGKLAEKKEVSGWRPEAVWTLREDVIREINVRSAGVSAVNVIDKVRRVFETTLPPHISEKHIRDAAYRGLWVAVRHCPIAYREQLCARFIKMFNIPNPPEPKACEGRIRTPRVQTREKVMVIDKNGQCWTWNMGWFRVGENGEKIRRDQRHLGHAEFRRVIVPATTEELGMTSFRYTRPWGMWRKGQGLVSHEFGDGMPGYGNGTLILTDGVHAVVEFADGVKREVALENLRHIEQNHSIAKFAKDAKTGKVVKDRKPTKKELTLEELRKML